MILVETPEDVATIQVNRTFLIQCPRTGIVYTIQKRMGNGGVIYFFAPQYSGRRYIVDTSQSAPSGRRYYFSSDRLTELIRDKSFAIER